MRRARDRRRDRPDWDRPRAQQARGATADFSAHVEATLEDERTSIAREIDDELGQSLTALKMDIAWIVRRESTVSSPLSHDALVGKLAEMSSLTDEVIRQVRRISTECAQAPSTTWG